MLSWMDIRLDIAKFNLIKIYRVCIFIYIDNNCRIADFPAETDLKYK